MDIVDLRDVIKNRESDLQTYDDWNAALLRACGDGIETVAENESLMIPEGNFKEYAQKLADDLGLTSKGDSWPLNCIDWDEATDELASDYSTVKVNGTTYLFRSY